MKTIGQRIKSIRKKAGLSQKELGKMLGVVASAISAYEKDEKFPNYSNIEIIAGLGGTTLDWLIAGKGPAEVERGEVAATIEPGDPMKRLRLLALGEKATNRNVFLRNIVDWMDREFGESEEQALFFYEDLKARYPSFSRHMDAQAEKKWPRDHHQVAEPEEKYTKNGNQ